MTENFLISAGEDSTVALYELESFSCLRTFNCDKKSASKVAFSSNEDFMAVLTETTLQEDLDHP